MTSTPRVSVATLQVAQSLFDVVERQILPDSGVDSAAFWAALAQTVAELGPVNRALLDKRIRLQVLVVLVVFCA
jgi:malate synthase